MAPSRRTALPALDLLRRSALRPAPDADLLGRFVNERDEAAFAALVERHGAMVLGTCHRMLGNTADAEDAFQAVFLALARDGGSVRRRASVAAWLYGAAYRVCLKARRGHARRRALAARLHPATGADPLERVSARELVSVLDDELARLPERFRLPVVLCLVEGLSQPEAAARLGCSAGSVKGRLERGREKLRRRLTRRGFALGTALPAAALGSASAAVPPALFTRALEAGGGTQVPAAVAGLARAAIPANAPRGWSVVALLIGGALIAAAAAGGPDEPPTPAEAPAKAAPARRDLYGDALPAGAIARFGTVRFRAGMWPKLLAVSPDGSRLVTIGHNLSRDNYLAVWHVETGEALRHVTLPNVDVHRVFWLPGGRGFAVTKVSVNDYVVWEFTDEKAPSPVALRPNEMNAIANGTFVASAVSPDGRLIASGQFWGQRGNEGKLEVWDLAANGRVRDMNVRWAREMAGAIVGLMFTEDSRSVIAVTQRREPNQPGVAPGPGMPVPVVGGKAAAVVNVSVRDATSGKETLAFEGPAGRAFAVSPDGKTFYSASSAGRVSAVDLTTGKEQFAFTAFPPDDTARQVSDLLVTPDGATLLAVRPLSAIAAFEARTGAERWRNAKRYVASVNSFALMPDGKRFVVGAVDGAILLGDVASGRMLNEGPGHRAGVTAVAVAADGRTAITTGDGTVRRWELATGKELARTPIDNGEGFRAMGFSPRQDKLFGITLLQGKWVAGLLDVATGKRIAKLPLDNRPWLVGAYGERPLAWLPDGSMVLADGTGPAIRFGPDGRELQRYEAPPGQKATTVAASPDGKTLVLAGVPATRDYRVRSSWVCAYDAASGRPGRVWEATTEFVNAAFTPDGSAVILTGTVVQPSRPIDQPPAELNLAEAVVLFDPACGEGFAPFAAAGDRTDFRRTAALAVAPTGHQFAVAEHDHSITVYETASGVVRARLRGHVNQVEQLAFTPDGARLLSASHDLTGLVWDTAPPAPAKAAALSEAERRARWEALASSDVGTAHRAMGELAGDPAAAVAVLKENLKPTPMPAGETIDRLIAQLDAAAFADRDAAARELERLGQLAVTPVRERIAAVTSTEVRRRLDDFLKRHDQPRRLTGPRLRERRAVELLEVLGTADARVLLRALGAAGDSPLARDAAAAATRLKAR